MHLTRRGTPQHPGELSEHSALLHLRNGSPYNTWRFSRGDETLEVEVHGDYLSDDAGRWPGMASRTRPGSTLPRMSVPNDW
jgi:hypothetical protein